VGLTGQFLPNGTAVSRPPRLAFIVATLGVLLVTAYAALAEIQILVLNPMAAVPSKPLTEIWAVMVREQGDYDRPVTTSLLAVGPVLAVALMVWALLRLRTRPRTVAAAYLGLLVLGTPAYAVASFSPGMNLADTFGIDGADYSPWAEPLSAVSAAAVVGLVILGATSGAGVFTSWPLSLTVWVPAGLIVGLAVLETTGALWTAPLTACGLVALGATMTAAHMHRVKSGAGETA
jgi:hypothetical protein